MPRHHPRLDALHTGAGGRWWRRRTEFGSRPGPETSVTAASSRLATLALSSPSAVPAEDVDYHVIQWKRGIQRHLGRMGPKRARILIELCNNDDLQSSIAYLEREYNRQGLATGIRSLEPTLSSISSFSQALTCLAQAGPESIQLLWGSILLLVKVTLRHTDILNKITNMLGNLTAAMPRFEKYLDLYPTPQLRRAMRGIYNDFVEFCLSSAKFLSRSALGNILRLAWSSTDKNFENISNNLQSHTTDFEAEAHLAAAEATKQWQDEVVKQLSKNNATNSSPSPVHLVSTLPFPRNLMFTGRHDTLQDISRVLHLPQAEGENALRSVTLHGMGGVGKTQIALEYAYRFRGAYSHIFWIKAETEIELRQSFSTLVKGLCLPEGGESEEKDINLARKWLDTTDYRWLLIFDNVKKVSLLRRYWPSGTKGNAIVTSQRPSFDELTLTKICIRPLTSQEGRVLILRQMHLPAGDDSIRDDAERLSEELGGSPLAISHYAGYCVASHLQLSEVLRTFQRRSMLAEIWSNSSNESMLQYDKTLSTVWDSALGTLTAESRDLLDTLAFLNPDVIPEDLLRSKPRLDTIETATYDPFKFSVVVSSLIRRNLVERHFVEDGPSLRMHRSLRLALMCQMDTHVERRQLIFKRALRLTREAFPRRNLTSRTPHYDPIWKQNIPQVLSLQSAFESSDPPMTGDMEFAGLLIDAGNFLWERQLNRLAVPLLRLAQTIAADIVPDDEPNPVLELLESTLTTLDANESIDGRKSAIARQKRVVVHQENYLSQLPPGTATVEDHVNVGRAWNDLGSYYADLEAFDEANGLFVKCLILYKSLGDEKTLRFQIAIVYSNIAWVEVAQGAIDEGLRLIEKAFDLCNEELGHSHPTTLRFESQWAYILLAANDVHGAREKLRGGLVAKSELFERDNPEILTSKYWIGTACYYLDDPEEAEQYLRESIEFAGESGFGQPDLARARYRLSLVLHEMRRRKDAMQFKNDAITSISDEDCPESHLKDEIMRLLDSRVFLNNGRSTGAFRGRRVGKE